MNSIKSSLTVFLYTACIVCFSVLHSQAQFKVVGYLVNWSNFVGGANAVDYSIVTHINVAFINPSDASGTLSPTTNLASVVTIVHNNNAQILASLGGAGASSTYWSAALASGSSRTAFITKVMAMVSTFNLDGIDVDIEGDLLNGSTLTSSQYQAFVTELGDSLHAKNKVMSAALGTWFGNQITSTAAQQFDWINAMAYDAYGTWTGPGQHSSYQFAVSDLNYWTTQKGVSKDHLVLGVPSYGYGWTGSTSSGSYSITYQNIVSQYPRAVNQDSIQPGTGKVIYYNGIPTIKNKTSLALTNASGIMMWTLQDDYPTSNPASLIGAIGQVVQASVNNIAPTVAMTAPTDNSSYVEGDTILLAADANDSDGSISKVSFYSSKSSTIYSIGDDVAAPYTATWIGAGPGTYTVYAKATDNAYSTTTSSALNLTITVPSASRSFGGPYNIPGKIEAENYDYGYELGYHDSDAANQGGAYRNTTVDIEPTTDTGGGYDVGWTVTGEWLKYTVNVTQDGNYDLSVRVATTGSNYTFHVELDGTNISGSIAVPNTGGWQTWQTVTVHNIALTQGLKAMKIVFDSGNFNINYTSFAPASVLSVTDADASGSVVAVVSPNPFSTDANLTFTLKDGGQTKITISNMIGASPVVLTDQYYAPGEHNVQIGNLNLPAGIYLCTITNGDHSKAVKVIKE